MASENVCCVHSRIITDLHQQLISITTKLEHHFPTLTPSSPSVPIQGFQSSHHINTHLNPPPTNVRYQMRPSPIQPINDATKYFNNESPRRLSRTSVAKSPDVRAGKYTPHFAKQSAIHLLSGGQEAQLMKTYTMDAIPTNKSPQMDKEKKGILPNSWFRVLVDFLYCGVVLHDWIIIFLMIAFGRWHEFPNIREIIPDVLCSAISFLYITINFRTSYLHRFTLMESIHDIRRNYIKTWLLFDIVAAFPWDLVLLSWSVEWYRIFKCFRLIRSIRVVTLFRQSNPLKDRTLPLRAFQTIIFLILFIHTIGCIWITFRRLYDTPFIGLTPDDEVKEYMDSLYWAAATLSTVGYGDITPFSKVCRTFTAITMIVGVSVFTSSISWYATMVQTTDGFRRHMKEKKRDLAALLDVYKVPWDVQKEVFSAFPHLLKTTVTADTREGIMRVLPPYLQEKVNSFVKLELLSNCVLFNGADTEFLQYLGKKLTHSFYASMHTFYEIGNEASEMYFLSGGVVEVLVRDEEEKCDMFYRTFEEGEWFGEMEVIMDVPRATTVRSITPISVFRLSKSDFISLLTKYPQFRNIINKELAKQMDLLGQQVDEVVVDSSAFSEDSESNSNDDCMVTSIMPPTPSLKQPDTPNTKNTSFASPNNKVISIFANLSTPKHSERNSTSGDSSRNLLQNSPGYSSNHSDVDNYPVTKRDPQVIVPSIVLPKAPLVPTLGTLGSHRKSLKMLKDTNSDEQAPQNEVTFLTPRRTGSDNSHITPRRLKSNSIAAVVKAYQVAVNKEDLSDNESSQRSSR